MSVNSGGAAARPEAVVLRPGEGERIAVGPNNITYKVTGEQSGGLFSVIEYEVGPNFQAPPVMHANTKEAWAGYVIEGTLGFEFDGERRVAAPAGSFLFLPPGTMFKWWNELDTTARWICIYSPAGFELYFKEVTEVLSAQGPGPLDTAKAMPLILPLWEKYGIE